MLGRLGRLAMLHSIALFAACNQEINAESVASSSNRLNEGGYCGDLLCSDPEDALWCATDCAQGFLQEVCGNNSCDHDFGETAFSCPSDCRPSCVAGQPGGDTCGPGEPGKPGSRHENCCTVIPTPMPGGSVAMIDKYMITAGRMRRFIEATRGDVRSYIDRLGPDARWNPIWSEYLPRSLNEAHDQLGPDYGGRAHCRYTQMIDGRLQSVDGARTYWNPDVSRWPAETPPAYSREVLDAKALNCAPPILMQAFCIWDGGRLQTEEEAQVIWGSRNYPWERGDAATDRIHQFANVGIFHPDPAGGQGWVQRSYAFPLPNGSGIRGTENYWFECAQASCNVAAPGRYPEGAGPFGHMDVVGNLIQMTSNWSPDGHPYGRSAGTMRTTLAGSFDVHAPYSQYDYGADMGYGAIGGRCTYLPPTAGSRPPG